MLPGIDVPIPDPGREHYPTWHGPFNRVPGLAEALVPGREDAYYGTFLRQSAGPAGLSDDALRAYLTAYRQPSCLAAGLGYYRTALADVDSVARRASSPVSVPLLTMGGEFGMGDAVAESLRGSLTTSLIPDRGRRPLPGRAVPRPRTHRCAPIPRSISGDDVGMRSCCGSGAASGCV